MSKRSPGGQLQKGTELWTHDPSLLPGYAGWRLHVSDFSWHVACLVSGLECLGAVKAGRCKVIVIVLQEQFWPALSMPGPRGIKFYVIQHLRQSSR